MQIDVLTTSGRKLKKLSLPPAIFAAKINPSLMAQAVRVYLSNQRQAPAKTKRRGEISLSGAKIYKQKGTGRARHSDRKPGIFVKGAKAHGPTGEQNFKLTLSKKMKKQALFSALTSKLKDGEILVVAGLEKIEPKTQKLSAIINKLKTRNSPASPRLSRGRAKLKTKTQTSKLTIILPEVMENIIRAGRNIPQINLKQAKLLNTYRVLNAGQLVFMPESIAVLKEHYLAKGK
jgi:large subunit ribosomal protein L4